MASACNHGNVNMSLTGNTLPHPHSSLIPPLPHPTLPSSPLSPHPTLPSSHSSLIPPLPHPTLPSSPLSPHPHSPLIPLSPHPHSPLIPTLPSSPLSPHSLISTHCGTSASCLVTSFCPCSSQKSGVSMYALLRDSNPWRALVRLSISSSISCIFLSRLALLLSMFIGFWRSNS